VEPYKKRLHLDKTEVTFLLGLVFLISSLMFCFGLLLGFGLKNKGSVEMTHAAVEKKTQSHGRSPASEHDKPMPNDKHEKVAEKSEVLAGQKLRQDYKESKQRGLVEMSLRSTEAVKPKSMVDARAHFASHPEWSRNPASEKDGEKFAKAEESAEQNKDLKSVSDEPAKEVPQGVKGLFERKPTSLDVFSPMPGSFTVQIASYATADESTAKVIELRKNNFSDAYVQQIKLKNGETWHRVSVGSFKSDDWARKTGEKLVKQKLASDFVVRKVANE
jgi:cell division septation protein DedD